MEPCHIPEIARLERLCFSHPWSEAALREELENPDAVFLVCLLNGKPAGYAGMHAPAGDCYLDNIAVFPQFRRQGLGAKLLEALEARAVERGGSFLTLEVRPSNREALALYRSRGYSEAGRRKNFYEDPREDALLLTKYF